jgi:hypothetical protein
VLVRRWQCSYTQLLRQLRSECDQVNDQQLFWLKLVEQIIKRAEADIMHSSSSAVALLVNFIDNPLEEVRAATGL